ETDKGYELVRGGDGTDNVKFAGNRNDYMVGFDSRNKRYTVQEISTKKINYIYDDVEKFEFAVKTFSSSKDSFADDKVSLNDTNNSVNSGSGNDSLTGNKGNDILKGGSGNDTYIFNEGDGQDTVSDTSGNDTLKIGTESRTIVLSKMADDLLLRMNDSSDSITVSGWFNESRDNKIETIKTNDASITHKLTTQLSQAMACYEDEKGISWTKALDEKRQDTKDILANHWIQSTENEDVRR
ncbi:MAG: hypothetical protein K9M56_02010, partial [Victivallales bacterium]|nr:hypothetical protein [Victivallales bacterium]